MKNTLKSMFVSIILGCSLNIKDFRCNFPDSENSFSVRISTYTLADPGTFSFLQERVNQSFANFPANFFTDTNIAASVWEEHSAGANNNTPYSPNGDINLCQRIFIINERQARYFNIPRNTEFIDNNIKNVFLINPSSEEINRMLTLLATPPYIYNPPAADLFIVPGTPQVALDYLLYHARTTTPQMPLSQKGNV